MYYFSIIKKMSQTYYTCIYKNCKTRALNCRQYSTLLEEIDA